jgi:hypothetical protein
MALHKSAVATIAADVIYLFMQNKIDNIHAAWTAEQQQQYHQAARAQVALPESASADFGIEVSANAPSHTTVAGPTLSPVSQTAVSPVIAPPALDSLTPLASIKLASRASKPIPLSYPQFTQTPQFSTPGRPFPPLVRSSGPLASNMFPGYASEWLPVASTQVDGHGMIEI